MNALYFERALYDEDDLQVQLESWRSDLVFKELDLMLEMVDAKEQLALEQAQLKICMENGSDDDLAVLYEEAQKESAETKKNIFARIWDAIMEICRSIKNAILGIFGKAKSAKIAADVEVEVPEDVIAASAALDKAVAKGNKVLDIATKVLVGLGVVAGTASVGYVGTKTVQNVKNGGHLSDLSRSIIEDAQKAFQSVTNYWKKTDPKKVKTMTVGAIQERLEGNNKAVEYLMSKDSELVKAIQDLKGMKGEIRQNLNESLNVVRQEVEALRDDTAKYTKFLQHKLDAEKRNAVKYAVDKHVAKGQQARDAERAEQNAEKAAQKAAEEQKNREKNSGLVSASHGGGGVRESAEEEEDGGEAMFESFALNDIMALIDSMDV